MVVTVALVPAGMAWVTVLSSINATMQLFLPGWVRARGLGVYQIVFAGRRAWARCCGARSPTARLW